MALMSRFHKAGGASSNGNATNSIDHRNSDTTNGQETEKQLPNDEPIRIFRLRIILMGILVSMGGLIFGYDTGMASL